MESQVVFLSNTHRPYQIPVILGKECSLLEGKRTAELRCNTIQDIVFHVHATHTNRIMYI